MEMLHPNNMTGADEVMEEQSETGPAPRATKRVGFAVILTDTKMVTSRRLAISVVRKRYGVNQQQRDVRSARSIKSNASSLRHQGKKGVDNQLGLYTKLIFVWAN